FLLQQLFNEGGRFFWIHNTGPIGCLPRKNMMNKLTSEDLDFVGCRKNENEIAQEFNNQLKDIVFQLRKNFTNAIFTYVDVYSAKYELIKNARNQGKDPSKYISWDGVHYSEAANKWLSTLIVNGSFSHPLLATGMLASQSPKHILG
ncbi:GDSL esterase/lipase ACHE-like, partial [Vigna umbellata]|uniref:GDSL esterase/lipase ACHE-like n=1 Tax=Vigna umbellata TaxID=87088 RepID=UPI001F5EB4F6